MKTTTTRAAGLLPVAFLMAAPLLAADPGASRLVGDATSRPIPGRFIVVFRDIVADPSVEAATLVRRGGGTLHFTYSHAVKGFAATLPPAAVAGLGRNPLVARVEQDRTVGLSATQSGATWGLDRVDQRALPLSGSYDYAATGAGVYAFIVDTGIRATHADFGSPSRVLPGDGYTAIGDGLGTDDCNGHGTHVAGTVGGATWGVAKGVALVPVRVLDCSGSGTVSGVVAGIDFVASKKTHRPAVANLSLSGGASATLDSAVARAVDQGVTVVVSAGNNAAGACSYSPAREPSALTIGATTSTDARASFSNFGSCLDLFAPGDGIRSAWHTGNTATATLSGTSMAAPHVAGVAALVLAQDAGASPATVAGLIVRDATPDTVTAPGTGSPNRLAYSLVDMATPVDGGGSGSGGGEPVLSGSGANSGKTWTATVTFRGAAGSATSGRWSYANAAGGCAVPAGAGTCSFALKGISKRVTAVTYTDAADSTLTVTIARP